MTITRDRNAFYLTGKVGEKRSYTPEGFLVCHDVPIARIGTQLYAADEVPIDPGPDGLVRVDRNAEEVFRAETISSFEGKPVTVNHPEEFVNPENWKNLTVGFVSNVRRGDGILDDLLLADLVITDADGIEYVNRELPEVSCGYEAEYRQVSDGRAEQHDIIGNHVALVDRGRAGSRCAIQDSAAPTEGAMKKKNWLDRLRALVKDAEAEEEIQENESCEDEFPEKEDKKDEKKEAKDADIFEERLARLEAVINKLIPLEEEEHGQQLDADPEAKKDDEEETVDTIIEPETAEKIDAGTVLMGDSFQSVLSRAEILCPGIAIPTGDAAKDRRAIPRLQLKAIQHVLTTDNASLVMPFLGNRELKTLTFDQLSAVFVGAAELMRHKNNGALAAATRVKDFGAVPNSPESINAKNREFWKNK